MNLLVGSLFECGVHLTKTPLGCRDGAAGEEGEFRSQKSCSGHHTSGTREVTGSLQKREGSGLLVFQGPCRAG